MTDGESQDKPAQGRTTQAALHDNRLRRRLFLASLDIKSIFQVVD